MALQLLTRISFFGVCILLASAADWTYTGDTGVDAWSDMFENCAGERQSPIDIVVDDVVVDNENLEPFVYINYDQPISGTLTMANNGHTIVLVPEVRSPATVLGGFNGVYQLLQFHFHWGSTDDQGSEHLINGMAYPMELHLVHTLMDIDDLSQVFSNPEGLAVLGVMFEIGDEDNEDLASFIDSLDQVKYKDDLVTIEPIALEKFLPETSTTHYYRYEGSLTTPMCYEAVRWSVFQDTVKISAAQMNKIRDLQGICDPETGCPDEDIDLEADYEDVAPDTLDGDEFMYNNYRPPQPLNGRTVYAYMPTDVSSAPALNASLALLSFIIAFFVLS